MGKEGVGGGVKTSILFDYEIMTVKEPLICIPCQFLHALP